MPPAQQQVSRGLSRGAVTRHAHVLLSLAVPSRLHRCQ